MSAKTTNETIKPQVDKKQQLAQALRANIKKRKQQAKNKGNNQS
jgi:hypothetical protein